MKKLTTLLVEECGPIYLLPPNDAEPDRMLMQNAEWGLPGFFGSLDCSQWKWKNCAKAHAGIYQNGNYKRTVVMETVCDEDMYKWHLFVGCPGNMNDLKVMPRSDRGELPPARQALFGQWHHEDAALLPG